MPRASRGTVPVEIGRDEARRAAQAELADPAYAEARPSPLDVALEWLADRLADLFGLAGALPGGPGALIVLVLVLAGLVVLIRLRVGRTARHGGRPAPAVFAEGRRPASEHRAAADAAWARGDLAESVRERFRAIVREFEERGILDESPGRTANEAAADAGAAVPDAALELRSAATLFDSVHYGGHAASADACHRLAALDDTLRGVRR